MNNGKDSPWEISVRELQRQIEAQNSEYELYQKQATLFLRISLATLGVIAGSISILGGDVILQMVDVIFNFGLENIASRIELSPTVSELVVGILSITSGGFCAASGYKILSIPKHTLRTAYPKRLRSGLNTYQTRKMVSDQSVNYKDYTISKLREAVIENEKIVTNTKMQFEKSLQGGVDGIRYGFISSLSFLLLVSGKTTLISVSAVFISLLALILLSRKFTYVKHKKFLKIYWETSITLFIVTIWVASLTISIIPTSGWLLFMSIVSLIIPFWGILYSNQERIQYIGAQLLGLIVVLFTVFYLHTSIRPNLIHDDFSFTLMAITVASITLLLEILLVYNILSLKKSIKEVPVRRKVREYISGIRI